VTILINLSSVSLHSCVHLKGIVFFVSSVSGLAMCANPQMNGL